VAAALKKRIEHRRGEAHNFVVAGGGGGGGGGGNTSVVGWGGVTGVKGGRIQCSSVEEKKESLGIGENLGAEGQKQRDKSETVIRVQERRDLYRKNQIQ